MKETPYGLIIDDLEIDILKNLCVPDGIQTGPFGSQLHQRDYLPVGTPIITVEHLGENRIIHQDLPCVSDADKKRLSKYVMCQGDIVFSRVGSVDRRALVRDSEGGWLFSGRCLRVRPDPTKIDSEYLSWFWGLDVFKDYIRRIAVGATMPSLNTTLLSNVPIFFPPLSEQRAIAEVLGSLDDKIELNRRMNRTLESIAQVVFREWFVNSEEVYKWGVGLLSDVADFVKGVSYRSVNLVEESETALVTLKSMARGGGYREDGLKPYIGEYKPEQRLAPGEVVVAHTDLTQAADVIGKAARVEPSEKHPNLVASLDMVIVRPKNKPYTNEFLYGMLSQPEFSDHAYGYTNGTTVLHLSSKALREYHLKIPPPPKIEEYSVFVAPIFHQIDNNKKESRTLAELRDILLPKLMRCEVRVKDVEGIL